MAGGGLWTLLALDRTWVRDALEAAVRDDAGHPFVALPYLVLMKLESGRLQDLADISRMMGCADEAGLSGTRRLIARYRPQDAEDLERMIRLGKLEHGDS